MPYCNKHSSQGNITWLSTASSISQPLVTSEIPRCPVKHFSFTEEADFSKLMRQFSFLGRNAKPEAAQCIISPNMEGNITTQGNLVVFPSLAGQPGTLVTRVLPWRSKHCLEQHRLWAYYRGLLCYRLGAWLSPFPKCVFKLSFSGLPRATGSGGPSPATGYPQSQRQDHSAPSQAHHSMSMATGGCSFWKKPGQKPWSCQQAGRPGHAIVAWMLCGSSALTLVIM